MSTKVEELDPFVEEILSSGELETISSKSKKIDTAEGPTEQGVMIHQVSNLL